MGTPLFNRVRRKLMHMRFTPIRVYCMHHVCKEFDESSMCKTDWTEINSFQHTIIEMRSNGIHFISLSEALHHLQYDIFRWKKYAVITFDDGYASLKEILPWLEKCRIPSTLFINGKYLDGMSFRDKPSEKYLTNEELWSCNSPYIEIGNHGWEHKDVTMVSLDEFVSCITNNVQVLSKHPRYIPFWAYTWGRHNESTDVLLNYYGLVPVLIDGMSNWSDCSVIHREELP